MIKGHHISADEPSNHLISNMDELRVSINERSQVLVSDETNMPSSSRHRNGRRRLIATGNETPTSKVNQPKEPIDSCSNTTVAIKNGGKLNLDESFLAIPQQYHHAKSTPTSTSNPAQRKSKRSARTPDRLGEESPQQYLLQQMDACEYILQFLQKNDKESYFLLPVDPVALAIPTYHEIISEPMDLGTIQQRLDRKEIKTPQEFERLIRLVFENAMLFNDGLLHPVHLEARRLLGLFTSKFKSVKHMIECSPPAVTAIPRTAANKSKNAVEKYTTPVDTDKYSSPAVVAVVSSRNESKTIVKKDNTPVEINIHSSPVMTCNAAKDESTDSNPCVVSTIVKDPTEPPHRPKKRIKISFRNIRQPSSRGKTSKISTPAETVPPVKGWSTEKNIASLIEVMNRLTESEIPNEILGVLQEANVTVESRDEEIDFHIRQLNDATQQRLFSHPLIIEMSHQVKESKKGSPSSSMMGSNIERSNDEKSGGELHSDVLVEGDEETRKSSLFSQSNVSASNSCEFVDGRNDQETRENEVTDRTDPKRQESEQHNKLDKISGSEFGDMMKLSQQDIDEVEKLKKNERDLAIQREKAKEIFHSDLPVCNEYQKQLIKSNLRKLKGVTKWQDPPLSKDVKIARPRQEENRCVSPLKPFDLEKDFIKDYEQIYFDMEP